MARLGMKDNRIRELYEEIAAFRLAADEARASKQVGEEHIEALERERARSEGAHQGPRRGDARPQATQGGLGPPDSTTGA